MKRDEDGLVRTFVAVWLDEPARRCVQAFAASLRAPVERAVGPVRWVQPGQYHFTLRFLGELDRGQRERVFEAVSEVCRATAGFSLRLGGLGAFPGPERPRVLWVGVLPPADGLLEALAERVERALEARGFGPADRPFTAHLTIGRVERPALRGRPQSELAEWWGRCPAEGCSSTEVREVVVMASRLTPAGPIYTPLMSAPLDGGGPGR
ncbi:MAG TPA: RNA 2',3'-cyclic phosphodiesterase [Limnochordales bacterium]